MNEEEIKAFLAQNPFHGELGRIDVPVNYGTGQELPGAPVYSTDNPFWGMLGGWDTVHTTPGATELNRLGVPFQAGEDNTPLLGAYQSGGEIFGRAIAGFGKQAVAGFTDAAASWDLQGMYNMAAGNSEEEFGNWLNESAASKWGKDMTGLEIYQYGDSMMSANYWGKMTQSLGYTGGIITEILAEQALINSIAPGAGAAGLANKTRLLGQGGFGMWKGVQEGYMNGMETMEQVYQEYKAKGYSDADAKRIAAEAATFAYRTEVAPLMIVNGLQFASIFGKGGAFKGNPEVKTGFSSLGESLLSKIPTGSNRTVQTGANLVSNAVSEGLEEGVQTTIGRYAQHKTDVENLETIQEFDVWSPETTDSVIAGIFGGALFAGGGNALNKVFQDRGLIDKVQIQQDFIKDSFTRTANSFAEQDRIAQNYIQAQKDFVTNRTPENTIKLQKAKEEVEGARYNSHLTNAINALQYDYLNGDTKGFDAHVNQLQTILDAVNSADVDTLKKFGLVDEQGKEKYQGSFETIKTTFQENIQDSQRIKDLLENNLNNVTQHFESAFNIVKKEFSNIKNLERLNQYDIDLQTAYNKDTQFNMLSPEGKDRFRMENEIIALEQVSRDTTTRELSQVDAERLSELKAEFSEAAPYSTKDKTIVPSISRQPYINAEVSKVSINQSIQQNIADLKDLKDLKKINENIKKGQEKAIENAKTKEAVQKELTKAAAAGVADNKMQELAQRKVEQLDINDKIQEIAPEVGLNEQPIPNSKERAATDEELNEALKGLGAVGSTDNVEMPLVSSEDSQFSRRSIGDIPQRAIDLANDTIASIEKDINRIAEFKDFIHSRIEKFGFDEAERMFDAYRRVWEATGRPISNIGEVYSNFFNRDELLNELLEGTLTEDEVTDFYEKTNAVTQNAQISTAKQDVFDVHGAPMDIIETKNTIENDRRTTSPAIKLSHYHQEYERGPSGEFIITSDSLVTNPFIGNDYILDPEFISQGDNLAVYVFDNDSVPITELIDNKPVKITWGDYKRKYSLTEEDPRYVAKVPMIAYKDVSGSPVPVSFISDATWYIPENINSNLSEQDRVDIAQTGYNNTVALREAILSGDNILQVSGKSFGQIDKINEHRNSEPITLREATGNSELAFILEDNGVKTLYTQKGKPFKGKIIGTIGEGYNVGGIVDLREVYVKDGEPVYIALHVLQKSPVANNDNLKSTLPAEIFNSIKYSTLAATVLNNIDNTDLVERIKSDYGITISKAKDIKNAISNTVGINIENNLTGYVGLFVQVGSAKYKDAYLTQQQNNDNIPAGQTFFDSFGKGELKVYNKANQTKVDKARPSSFGSKVTNVDIYMANLVSAFNDMNGSVMSSAFNINFDRLNSTVYAGKGFVTLDNTGTPVNNYQDYNDFIKTNVFTNVRSHEIETIDGTKKWITDIQPVINISLPIDRELTVPTSSQGLIEQVQQNIIETPQEYETAEQEFYNSLSEEEKALYATLGTPVDGLDNPEILSSRRVNSQEERDRFTKFNTNKITTLSTREQSELVGSLKNLIISDIDFKAGVKESDIKRLISQSVSKHVQPILNNYKAIYDNMSKIPALANSPNIRELQVRINKLQGVVNESLKLTSLDVNNKGSITKEFDKLLNLDLQQSEDLDIQDLDNIAQDEQENETDLLADADESFTKSFMEKDLKLSYSNKLKLSLFGIPKLQGENKNKVVSVLTGLPQFESADDVELRLKDITTEIISDWDTFIDKLDYMYQTGKGNIYSQLKSKFENEEVFTEQLRNELLYKMISSRLNIYKVLNRVITDKAGNVTGYELQVIDENNQKEDIRLRAQIRDFFTYTSVFSRTNERNERVLNLEVAKKYQTALKNRIKENSGTNNLEKDKVKEIFYHFGLDFSDNTIDEYLKTTNPFSQKNGILFYIEKGLTGLIDKSDNGTIDVVLTEPENNLFDNASGALNRLIEMEISLNGTNIAKSIRVGGKVMQGTIQNTSAYDTIKKLTSNRDDIIDTLQEIGYTKNNVLLQLLKDDPNFKNILSIDFSSPEAYKVHGRDLYSDADFDKISPQDNLSATMGLFMNLKGFSNLSNPTDIRAGLTFRVGQLPFNTLSDKGRMIYLKTALVEAKHNISTADDGSIELDDNILSFLTEQLFQSEFNRIIDAYKYGTHGIQGFDNTSKIFTLIPKFNTITVGGINIHDLLKVGAYDIEKYIPEAKRIISEVINEQVDSKLSKDGEAGELRLFGMHDGTNISTSYLKQFKGNTTEQIRLAMADYSLNYMLNQANVYQLFLGDAAYYSKDKLIPTYTENGQTYIDSKALLNNNRYVDIAKAISVIVDKRAASLIAPGSKLANSEDRSGSYNTQYLQVQVNDVESMSEVMRELIISQYGELTLEQTAALDNIDELNKKIEKALEQNDTEALYGSEGLLEQKQENIAVLENTTTGLDGYFNMTGTDAQEYTTWRAHVDILQRKGDLTEEQLKLLKSAYDKMSANKFEEVTTDEINVVMQPVKPVYTGQIPLVAETTDANGNKVSKIIGMRPLYIKSSSFPLLPQLTKNLRIDAVRQKLEALEQRTGKTVRMSYQTANKIGASKTKLTMNDLYYKPMEELYNVSEAQPSGLLADSVLTLNYSDFKIQQETPVKTKKFLAKNSDNYITMGSQFWKIKLANGINKITDKIFPDLYSRELLRELGITPENGMISGVDLDKIDFEIYKRFSETQKEILYSELGLEEGVPFNSLTIVEKTKVMDNLISIIRDEIITRGYPDYLQNVLGVNINENNISTEIPLMLDANANKFEALLQALISNRLIAHKLPGNGHISTSSEGFEKVTTLDELDANSRQGIVWIDPNRVGRLKATKNSNGRIMESEVLIQSHYRVTIHNEDGSKSTQLIDMMSDDYSEPIVDSEGKVTGRQLRLEKIDKTLLNNFSFRIPTSSHQSGVILKVVGFLPPQSGDMLVVPAEHTVQLGEDYDIDKRYVYKSNYYLNRDGIIKELPYKDYSVEELVDDFLSTLQDEDLQNVVNVEVYKRNKMKIKAYENVMLNIYKSVYQSPSDMVQKKIFKPLVTDIAETTAFAMDSLLSSNASENFTMLGDSYQRYLLNLGADGKGGIGKHSNAVTFEAQLQRLPDDQKLQLKKFIYNEREKAREWVDAEETIGGLTSTGKLGAQYKTLDGYRDIAEQHGENQNVSTDNINKQIMGKRNENSYTMGVYALMAMRGFDLSLDKVSAPQLKEPTQLHIPSLFVNQPIIRDYVELMQKYSSITAEFLPNKELFVVQQLVQKYGFPTEVNNTVDFLPEEMYEQMSEKMDGQRLWDNLEVGPAMEPELQLAVLQKFMRFKTEENQLAKAQRLINLSTSKLGVSYFETLQRISMLDDLGLDRVSGAENLIGESRVNPYDVEELTEEQKLSQITELKAQGFKLVGKYFWKPTTTEGVMLLNSLSAAQDLMDIFFPYNHPTIKETISYIFAQKNKDVNDTSGSALKWKYEIMTAFRDFAYSGTNTTLFRGDVNEERRRLFFNTESNFSLAKILQTLRKEKNPIMDNLFLKDLQLQVRDVVPSLITATANFNTNFDKTTKYEAFLELVNDHTNLGMYNGEVMTPHKLAQDLATYAMLSDNQNGATGFRQYIHVDYLKAIGFTKDLRNLIYDINNGKDMSGFVEKFEEQYFQHHPERAFILSNNTVNKDLIQLSDMKAQTTLIRALEEGKNINNLINNQDSFKFDTGIEGYEPEYVAVRNTSIINSENKYSLFKYDPHTGLYIRIETLGTTGYNEYNANAFSQPSLIPNNVDKTSKFKGNVYFDTGLNRQVSYMPVSDIFPESKGISYVLEAYMNSVNTPQEDKEFIENLIKYGNPNAKLVYQKPTNGALGSYNRMTNEIYINPNIYEIILAQNNYNMIEARNVLREIFLEEIIHSMTVREFDKYVQNYNKATGEIELVNNAPTFVTKLVALFQTAQQAIPYDSTDKSTYYSKDIYEFMAGMFVAPDYRERLEAQSPNMVRKFLKIIRDMLGSLYTAVTGENFSYKDETFDAVYSLLKTSGVTQTAPNTQSGNIIEDMKNDDVDLSDTELNDSPREEGFRYPEIKKC